MSKEGVPSQKIIEKMRKSHTVYRLDVDQLAQLEKEGVSAPVVNYMQKAYLKAVRRNQKLEDWSYWWPRDWMDTGMEVRLLDGLMSTGTGDLIPTGEMRIKLSTVFSKMLHESKYF